MRYIKGRKIITGKVKNKIKNKRQIGATVMHDM